MLMEKPTFRQLLFFLRYQRCANDSKWSGIRGAGAGAEARRGEGGRVEWARTILEPLPLTFLYASLSDLSRLSPPFRFTLFLPICSFLSGRAPHRFLSTRFIPSRPVVIYSRGVTSRSGRSAN